MCGPKTGGGGQRPPSASLPGKWGGGRVPPLFLRLCCVSSGPVRLCDTRRGKVVRSYGVYTLPEQGALAAFMARMNRILTKTTRKNN